MADSGNNVDTILVHGQEIVKTPLRMIQLWPDGSEWPRYLWAEKWVTTWQERRRVVGGFTRVLDVGCNSGVVLTNLVRRCNGIQGLGIDPDPGHIQFCRERWECKELGRLRWRTMAAEDLHSLEDPLFDAALCMEVLEHLPDPLLGLREIRAKLKARGYLIVTVPNPEGPAANVAGHLHRWTSEGLRELVTEAGFKCMEVTQIQKIGYGPTSIGGAFYKK